MRLKHLAPAAALLALAPFCVSAQESGNIANYYYFDVKAGHSKEFGKGIEAYWKCYGDNNGVWSWSAWRPVSGKLGAVLFRSGGHDWADFDADDPASDACTGTFENSVAPHVSEVYSGFTRELDDLSHVKEGPVEVVMTYDVDVSDMDAALAIIKSWHEAFVAADWGNYTWEENITSSSGKWDLTVAILNENYAGMKPGERSFDEVQEAHHGKRKADKLSEDWLSVLKGSRTTLWERLDKMSYKPAE